MIKVIHAHLFTIRRVNHCHRGRPNTIYSFDRAADRAQGVVYHGMLFCTLLAVGNRYFGHKTNQARIRSASRAEVMIIPVLVLDSSLTVEKSFQQTSPSPRTSICLNTSPTLFAESTDSIPGPALLLLLVANILNSSCPMCFWTTAKN